MTAELLLQADLILVMEHYHFVEVQKELPYAQWHKLHLLNDFCFAEKKGIEDPLFSNDQYEFVFNQIEACCKVILTKI